MDKRFLKIWKYPSMVALVAANCLPVAGILFFGWKPFDIVFLYWLETFVIGLFAILKLAVCMFIFSKHPPADPQITRSPIVLVLLGLFVIAIPLTHLTAYMFLSLSLFLPFFSFLGAAPRELSFDRFLDMLATVAIPLVALLASHSISFAVNFVAKKEYLQTEFGQKMLGKAFAVIFTRAFPMIFVVAGGAILAVVLRTPHVVIALLVLLKVAVDILSHSNEHKETFRSIDAAYSRPVVN